MADWMNVRRHRFWLAVAVAAFMTMIEVGWNPSAVHAANDREAQVTVPQSALNSLIGEPDRHFHRAADFYVKGDADDAASEIRAAAGLIRIEAGRGSADDRTKLEAVATNLDALASNVVNGNVGSRRDLELAFARADLALAAHYRSMADKALADKDHTSAGRWLKAAGDSVDEAAAWTGRSPSGAQAEAWDQMHALQAKIRTSTNWSYDQAKKGVGYLGTEIQYLGQQMQNYGASGGANHPN
jgi:hypothetical protein